MFSTSTLASTRIIQTQFASATPYRHVAIDGFLEGSLARELFDHFPHFASENAQNEFGKVGKKAVIPSLKNLAEPFQRIDLFFAGPQFLNWVSEITGIPGLIYHPDNFGGGTHENLDGQELLPHVDFNFHPSTGHHRRINLIIYLNPEWKDEWGGALQIHSNPREALSDTVKAYAPVFNRCVIFETNEHSWHGFERIRLPKESLSLSRKSLSIYLYSLDRPSLEKASPHATFYVPRPLPDHFSSGRTLSHQDVETLRYLIRTRDDLLSLHQRLEASRENVETQLNDLRRNVAEMMKGLCLPLIGYVKQAGDSRGFYPDRWCDAVTEFGIQPLRDISKATFRILPHADLPEGSTIKIFQGGDQIGEFEITPGRVESLTCRLQRTHEPLFTLRIECSAAIIPAERRAGDDKRSLAFNLFDVLFDA